MENKIARLEQLEKRLEQKERQLERNYIKKQHQQDLYIESVNMKLKRLEEILMGRDVENN